MVDSEWGYCCCKVVIGVQATHKDDVETFLAYIATVIINPSSPVTYSSTCNNGSYESYYKVIKGSSYVHRMVLQVPSARSVLLINSKDLV